MAATGKTTNYALPLYNENDITTWSDFNLAMTDIDTAVKGVSDTASTGSSTASQALSAANAASTLATEANNNATTATSKANDAVAIANNANTLAGDATTDAHAALTAANTATENIATINGYLSFNGKDFLTALNIIPNTDYNGTMWGTFSDNMGRIMCSIKYTTTGMAKIPRVNVPNQGEFYAIGRTPGRLLLLNANQLYTICSTNRSNASGAPVAPAGVWLYYNGSHTDILMLQSQISVDMLVWFNSSFFNSGAPIPMTINYEGVEAIAL